jgi:hypothetical protein
MTPKIDYGILGRAVEEFEALGYTYVEVPWVVPDKIIRATLSEEFGYFEQAMKENTTASFGDCRCPPPREYRSMGGLIGSAEQGFLALDLPKGRYVGVSPCFRDEHPIDLLRRPYFMKVELFVTDINAVVDDVIHDARSIMALYSNKKIDLVQTPDGFDLEISGIEVGSYGERDVYPHGRWVYGTGMALPRFHVAQAIASIT